MIMRIQKLLSVLLSLASLFLLPIDGPISPLDGQAVHSACLISDKLSGTERYLHLVCTLQ